MTADASIGPPCSSPRGDSESPSPTPRDSPRYGRNVRMTVAATQGGRKYMEDRVHIECVRRPDDGDIDYIFVAVYDGHGGPEASEFARQFLLANIQAQREFQSNHDEDILTAIRQGFIETHQAMWRVFGEWPRTASGYASTAGTTASVAFIRNGKLYTGHVGDSAIILGKRMPDGSVLGRRLTIDHKPECVDEERRIEDAGGQVLSKAGVMRVVWNRPARGHTGPVRRSTPREAIPFLAVARALGDLWSYNADTDQFVVSPEPDVDVHELKADDACLVVCSDGMTNVIRPQFALDIVNTHEWRELAEERGPHAQLLTRPCHSNHSRWLLRHSLRGWGGLRADNISVVTVIFDPPGSELPEHHACVEHSDLSMDIDRELSAHPEAMIRICPDACQRLRTAPVEIVYSGAVDPNMINVANFVGPGFTMHSPASSPAPGFAIALTAEEAIDSVDLPESKITTRTWNETRTYGLHNYFQVVQQEKTERDGDANAVIREDEDREDTVVTVATTTTAVRIASGNAGEESDEESKSETRVDHDGEGQSARGSKKRGAIGQSADTRQASLIHSPPKTPKFPACHDEKNVKGSPATGQSPTTHSQGGGKKKTGVGTITPRRSGRIVKYFCRQHGLDCAKVKRANAEYFATGQRHTPIKKMAEIVDDGAHETMRASDTMRQRDADATAQRDEECIARDSTATTSSAIATTPESGTVARRGRGRPPGSARRLQQRASGVSVETITVVANGVERRDGLRMRTSTAICSTRMASYECNLPSEMPSSRTGVSAATSVRVPRSSPRTAARRANAAQLSPLVNGGTAKHGSEKLAQSDASSSACSTPLTPFRRLALDNSATRAAMAGGASGFAAAMRSVVQLTEENAEKPVKRAGMATRAFRSLSSLRGASSSSSGNAVAGPGQSSTLSSAQKRRLDHGESDDHQLAPAAKRSRLWGFISNIIGGTK